MVYFGLQFCYLIRKFCIQTWNSVSDAIKSLYAQISANLEKLGLLRPHCYLRPFSTTPFNYVLILVLNVHLLSLKRHTKAVFFAEATEIIISRFNLILLQTTMYVAGMSEM